MKGYRYFIIIFSVLLVVYITMELNKPKPIDWTVSLSNSKKAPYGGYIINDRLKDLFPNSKISSYRTPFYEQINNFNGSNTAYILMGPSFELSKADVDEMKNYVINGNYVFLAYGNYPKTFLDSFKLKTDTRFSITGKDSTTINFVNPALKAKANYTFLQATIDDYFSSIDTSNHIVLGINDKGKPNFIKMPYGEGAFFVHTNPICFSNYFLLHHDNATYAAKALSYIPKVVSEVYWDEYYKLGRGGASTPLRFLLSNDYLKWALRIALFGMILYVLFQLKRKQRIITVIAPLKNTSMDFIRTVASLYFNAKDNNGIADKKINYWLDFVRHRFNLSTQVLNEEFMDLLSRKSGVEKKEINELIVLIAEISSKQVNDNLLLMLNNKIDNFYKQV